MAEEKDNSPQVVKSIRSQRKLRNYLINKKFQLKYTLMIAALSTILVLILGYPLYKTVAYASDQLAAQVLANPIYSSEEQVNLLLKSVESEKRKTIAILGSFLLVLLTGLILSGIYITHKVAGPMYKMRKLLSEVGLNHLVFKGRLRKGDELVELFESFNQMIERLRKERKQEIENLVEIVEQLKQSPEKGNLNKVIQNLEKIIDRWKLSLE